MLPLLLWLLPALALGFLGRHRALGFGGFFLASIAFSPILVLLLLLITRPVRPDTEATTARAKGAG